LILAVLLRESVFQYHFELWGLLPFLWASTSLNKTHQILGYLVSFHFKLLGIIGALTLFFKKHFYSWAILTFLMGFSGVIFYGLGFFDSSGLQAFGRQWLWAPGFINFLWPWFQDFLTFEQMKMLSAGVGGLLIVGGALKKDKEFSALLIFCLWTFMYFSPVYNAWYALWPGLLLLLRGNSLGAWALILSPFCYIYFVSQGKFLLLGTNFLAHLPYLVFTISYLYGSFNEGPHLGTNHSQGTRL
jgi:hypothetical protein